MHTERSRSGREREREREDGCKGQLPGRLCAIVCIRVATRKSKARSVPLHAQPQFSFTPADLSAVDNASHIEMQLGS